MRDHLVTWIPALGWLRNYDRTQLPGDLIAGLIVAVMIVPQSMAYAVLAGLPPQIGLYASILPMIIYGFMGSSRTLSVGPTAIAALLTASAVNSVNPQNEQEYLAAALTLTLMVGVIRVVLGLLRAGFVVNFISHMVLSGFVNAAAIIISTSQINQLLGLGIETRGGFIDQLVAIVENLSSFNPWTAVLGVAGLGMLVYFQKFAAGHFEALGLSSGVASMAARVGPLFTAGVATAIAFALRLESQEGVEVVGTVPSGLPPITMPATDLNMLITLLPQAIILSLVGFTEGISIAKALASRDREQVDANQELVAIGVANVGAAITGGMPVSGSPSRSALNYTAGARSGVASFVTASVTLLAILALTPLFYYIPHAVIAAIVMVSVSGLFEAGTLRRVWAYRRGDAATLIITFVMVLALGIEIGLLIGVGTNIALYLWRTSHPEIVELGRVTGTFTYRNVERHETEVDPRILLIRIDESLYFANTQRMRDEIWARVRQREEIEHLVLVGTSINDIDASALETLEELTLQLNSAGISVHLAGFTLIVLDRLRNTWLLKLIGPSRVYATTNEAVEAIQKSSENEPVSGDDSQTEVAQSRVEEKWRSPGK